MLHIDLGGLAWGAATDCLANLGLHCVRAVLLFVGALWLAQARVDAVLLRLLRHSPAPA